IGADKTNARGFFANAVQEKKPRSFLDANGAITKPAISQDLHPALVGTHVFTHLYELERAFFFKLWTDPREFASRRNDYSKHALTRAPAHAGEIRHAGAGLDVDSVDLVLLHQPLRFSNTLAALLDCYRRNAIGHSFELANRFRSFALLGCGVGREGV